MPPWASCRLPPSAGHASAAMAAHRPMPLGATPSPNGWCSPWVAAPEVAELFGQRPHGLRHCLAPRRRGLGGSNVVVAASTAAVGAAAAVHRSRKNRRRLWHCRAALASGEVAAATVADPGAAEATVVVRSLASTHAASSASVPVASGIGRIVERLYDQFNACDVDGTAECFTTDVVYEDLLLGNATIVESREDFRELIQTHPVFVSRWVCDTLRLPAPDLAVRVDSISEDSVNNTVGVSWHVEVRGEPLAMGRGLSFMRICPNTGLIMRAVDIAEAPWRVVGVLLSPFARTARFAARCGRLANFAREPPAFVAAMVSALAPPTLLFAIFLDRNSLDSVRQDINMLADFRDQLDIFLL